MKVRHSLACTIAALSLVALHARADSDRDRERDRDRDRTTTVDCAAGDTVATALRQGDERKSLTILINGSCSEHVQIDRNDVTLAAAAPGATISGPDPTTDVIRVTASRVAIEGLTVTGGRNGITANGASGFMVRNALVQNTGRNGITYARGASGVVDGTVVTGNARDGVAIDAAQGTVINSRVGQNARMGVGVFNGGSARIGIDNFNNAAGNAISANASNGIHIVFGSSALIAMNQITGNGTSDAPGNLRNGINLASASADIIGGNTISGHTGGTGVNLVRSTAIFGDALFDLTTVNTISGNGSPASQGGIFAFNGSSVTIRDTIITNNVGAGLFLSFRSQAQISGNTIQNNVPPGGDGIRVVLGSALFPTAPNGVVSGNAGFGLLCASPESSVANFPAGVAPLGLTNGLTDVAGCTGF